MGFQNEVFIQPAPAVEGDFCGANPRANVLAGAGELITPASGLFVGRFAWANTDTGVVSQSYVAGYQLGFVRREQQALITEFKGEATLFCNAGILLTLFNQGDFWARFAAGASPGQRVYADPNTGLPVAGAPSGLNVASVTAHAGAGFTGVVATNVLTASSVTGTLTPGDVIVSASIPNPGVVLGAQLTGPAGGAGTYTLVHADVASEAMVANSVKLQVTAVASGVLGAGSKISGTNVTDPTVIVSQDSGAAGGIGVYTISPRQRFASTTVSENAIATPWYVNSLAAAGELAKISSWST